MKKWILIFSCFLFLGNVSHAQSMYGDAAKADVKMKYVYSFEEALQKARETKKPIFFNCFADWAVPCHGMNRYVFSDQAFADWMDKHFVNLFIDVTTPEGRPFAEKYNARMMAHYLVLDADGKLIHRIVGGCQLPEFQEKVACALSPKTSLAGLTERYDSGDRDVKMLGRYATVLSYANDDERYEKVTDEYFAKLKPSQWSKKENWNLFRGKARTEDSEKFRYLVEHKDEFAKNMGDSIIETWISGVYFMPVFRVAIGELPYEAGKLLDIYMTLKKTGIPEDSPVYIVYDIAKYRGEKNFDKVMQVYEQKVPGMDERVAMSLDMALKDWKELSVGEKKRVADYLDKRTKGMSGNMLQTYQKTAKDMVNPEGIQFVDLSLNETLEQARKEGKLVFLDCYTSWCGPCKMMSSRVFTQKYVGEYFKQRFVSLKVDMEKGEGPELAKKYNVKAYPTMLVLNADGSVKYKILGGADARTFMEKVERGVQPEISYTALKEKYEAGDRSNAIMPAYLVTMHDAGELKDPYNDLKNYLNSLKEDEQCSKETWKLYDVFVTDYNSPEFQFLVENRKKMIEQVDENVVNKKMEEIIFPVVLEYLGGTVSADDWTKIRKLIQTAQFPADFSLPLLEQIVMLYNQQDYDGIVNFYKDTVGKLPNGHTKLNLDVLLPRVLAKAPADIRSEALAYARQAAEGVDARVKNNYNSLLEVLEK